MAQLSKQLRIIWSRVRYKYVALDAGGIFSKEKIQLEYASPRLQLQIWSHIQTESDFQLPAWVSIRRPFLFNLPFAWTLKPTVAPTYTNLANLRGKGKYTNWEMSTNLNEYKMNEENKYLK